MFNDGVFVFLITLCAAVFGVAGWFVAHVTIATECERLGAFYVSDKTFICELKK